MPIVIPTARATLVLFEAVATVMPVPTEALLGVEMTVGRDAEGG